MKLFIKTFCYILEIPLFKKARKDSRKETRVFCQRAHKIQGNSEKCLKIQQDPRKYTYCKKFNSF